ncbi:phage tail assembly chaperone [Pseudomonas simiae]|uniref:Phage tail assembly chaperone-like domain-containing protein n=1 Tax=Pseudomonas simiae TaxID=321846 RepID=U1TQF0_9PSED|nr:phage tail assembly chaperone [Pseudomonas simiae]ERH60364.1 hypothetical protein O204_19170 [Pseudomonas simiae]
MFYFSATDGFLSSKIHGKNIPADAVKITDQVYADLLIAQNSGQLIQLNADGVPVAVAAPGPTDEQLAITERAWRDQALSVAIGLRDRHRDQLEIDAPTTLSGEQFKELLQYMQTLRDWPQSSGFPHTGRPSVPAWMADE